MRSSAVQYVWGPWPLYIKMFKHPGGRIKNAHTVISERPRFSLLLLQCSTTIPIANIQSSAKGHCDIERYPRGNSDSIAPFPDRSISPHTHSIAVLLKMVSNDSPGICQFTNYSYIRVRKTYLARNFAKTPND